MCSDEDTTTSDDFPKNETVYNQEPPSPNEWISKMCPSMQCNVIQPQKRDEALMHPTTRTNLENSVQGVKARHKVTYCMILSRRNIQNR